MKRWWRRREDQAVAERLEHVADRLEEVTQQLRNKVERLRTIEETGKRDHG